MTPVNGPCHILDLMHAAEMRPCRDAPMLMLCDSFYRSMIQVYSSALAPTPQLLCPATINAYLTKA